MPGVQRPPTDDAVLGRIIARVEDLERRTTPTARPGAQSRSIFSWDTVLSAAADPSGPDMPDLGGQIVTVVANSDPTASAAAGDSDIDILLNGVVIGTVTLAAGEVFGRAYLGGYWVAADSDVLQVQATAGGGHTRPVVQIRMRR